MVICGRSARPVRHPARSSATVGANHSRNGWRGRRHPRGHFAAHAVSDHEDSCSIDSRCRTEHFEPRERVRQVLRTHREFRCRRDLLGVREGRLVETQYSDPGTGRAPGDTSVDPVGPDTAVTIERPEMPSRPRRPRPRIIAESSRPRLPHCWPSSTPTWTAKTPIRQRISSAIDSTRCGSNTMNSST
jgi:hypothetical protein